MRLPISKVSKTEFLKILSAADKTSETKHRLTVDGWGYGNDERTRSVTQEMMNTASRNHLSDATYDKGINPSVKTEQ